MNYPVWDVPFIGSGLVVAIIAIIHVLISHLAIGGGAFIYVAEYWSDRQKNGQAIRDWLHQYATYFLVYTTVFGAVTGVGIWFAIQLANPEGTSLLIHQFVFAWAIEWVLFLGELSILYLYYYGWQKNSRRMQLWLAGLYFVIAWGSLFVINGILAFMLTPGAWSLANTSILAGFFNPGFLPSLFIRTLVMFMVAGLFAIIVATRVTGDDDLKERMIGFAAKWIIPGALMIPFLLLWYWATLPESATDLIRGGVIGVEGGRLEIITRYFWLALVSGALIVVGTLLIAIKPKVASLTGAIALFLIAQFGFLGAEFAREMARKPYVIYGVLYSNGLWQHNAVNESYMQKPYLEKARWDPDVDPLSRSHGEWVFRLQCVGCHTRDGYRSIKDRTSDWNAQFAYRWLQTMHEQGVMPPFQGNREDRAALAAYLMSLHDREVAASDIIATDTLTRGVAEPVQDETSEAVGEEQ